MGNCCEPAHASRGPVSNQNENLPPGLIRSISPSTAQTMVLLPKTYPFTSASSSCLCSQTESNDSPCFVRRAKHLKNLPVNNITPLSPSVGCAKHRRPKSPTSNLQRERRSKKQNFKAPDMAREKPTGSSNVSCGCQNSVKRSTEKTKKARRSQARKKVKRPKVLLV